MNNNKLEGKINCHRKEIEEIIQGQDDRLLVVVGPCSVHNVEQALDYADKLKEYQETCLPFLKIVMRVYGDKPRTTVGWKGVRKDPHLSGVFDVKKGLNLILELMRKISEKELAIAEETLEPRLTECSKWLLSYHVLGARSSEHQPLREYFSSLSTPCGIKHPTSGNLKKGSQSVYAVTQPQFLIDHISCVGTETKGNKHAHMVLRGGDLGTNLDEYSILTAVEHMRKLEIPNSRVLLDVSHDNCVNENSSKDYLLQIPNVSNSLNLMKESPEVDSAVIGFMIESNLKGGSQKMAPKKDLEYGVSITDPCISWEQTVEVLDRCSEHVSYRRKKVS